MSAFNGVESAPPIEVFKLTRDFQVNTDPNKVSLEVGAYRTDEGKPEWIIHEYLPVLGHDRFAVNATKMLLGPDSKALKAGLAFGIQSLSGTCALHNSGDFLAKQLGKKIATF